MRQLTKWPGEGWFGCKGTDCFYGYSIACEAWGGKAKQCGLASFPYLWRRFGPPWQGSDDYKSIADYQLTTKNKRVVLWITCSPGQLCYQIGALWSPGLREEIEKPWKEWGEKCIDEFVTEFYPGFTEDVMTEEMTIHYYEWMQSEAANKLGRAPRASHKGWQHQTGAVHELNSAVFEALRELEKPVYVRDQYFNIFGTCEPGKSAKYSRFAGHGIPRKPMLRLIKKEESQ